MAEGRKQAKIARCLNELSVPNLNIINQKNNFPNLINVYFCNCDMESHYSRDLGDESWWWAKRCLAINKSIECGTYL